MKRIMMLAVIAAATSLLPAHAQTSSQSEGAGSRSRSMGHDLSARADLAGNSRGMTGRANRCSPMVRDIYWLDYSRGMRRGTSSPANKPKNKDEAQNRQNRTAGMGRRMRILRLKHNGFPPKPRCPTCGNVRMGGGGSMRPLGKMPSMGKMQQARKKRRGADGALKQAVVWLETPDNNIHRVDAAKPGVMRFSARMWGLHKIFAHLDGGIRNNTHSQHFAFYDMFSHGDEVSKQNRPVLDGDGYWQGYPEFELSRIYENERQQFSSQSGQTARFRVSLRGKPVKEACVVMITQKGWRNAKKSDENGEVSFFLVKESPTEGGWQARRQSAKYLVSALHSLAKSGELDQVPFAKTLYSATMMMRVRPSRLEWESKSTAFIVGSFTMIAAGAAIAIRRTRRRRKTSGKGGA